MLKSYVREVRKLRDKVSKAERSLHRKRENLRKLLAQCDHMRPSGTTALVDDPDTTLWRCTICKSPVDGVVNG